MIRLKRLLVDHKISQGELAAGAGLSRPRVVGICNHGLRGTRGDAEARAAIETYLSQRGIAHEGVFRKEVAATRSSAPRPVPQSHQSHQQEPHMLRKQTLNPKARAHWGLAADPFGECTSPDDVFRSPHINFLRESISDKVKHGGMLAVIGQSGAGKSTIREETVERYRNDPNVVIIEPYILTSAINDQKGRVLKAANIMEAIMAVVAPTTPMRSRPDAWARQIHELLRDSARSGHRHCLLIEEAHDLAIPTLKSLKRFIELKDGMRSLLSIVLVGQPELAKRLSEHNPEVREVAQRLEIVWLQPLDNDLEAYLVHRFRRANKALADVLDTKGLDAIKSRLGAGPGRESMLYPLSVHNLLAAAMNAAADLGAPKVSAEVVREVLR